MLSFVSWAKDCRLRGDGKDGEHVLNRWHIKSAMAKGAEVEGRIPNVGLIGEDDTQYANVASDW